MDTEIGKEHFTGTIFVVIHHEFAENDTTIVGVYTDHDQAYDIAEAVQRDSTIYDPDADLVSIHPFGDPFDSNGCGITCAAYVGALNEETHSTIANSGRRSRSFSVRFHRICQRV